MPDVTTPKAAPSNPPAATALPREQRPNLFPALRYHDADAAMRWLETTLGFVTTQVFRGDDGRVAHAELALGPGTVMVSSTKDDDLRLVSSRDVAGATTCCLCLWIPDLDAVAARIRAAGVPFVYGPRDTHYGSRELAVRDAEGQLWVVGTYYPGDPC
jgi:uncharacterized glyoxalase superfamily protein PhnB